ncbi:hypothetical protein LTR08_003417 [Meristemomyces frigidus]|nr:hypothetical protein LTR08_003417 [Meristemomyces frigidus]
MFQAFSYGLIFLTIIACNHKWGKPYEEAKVQKEKRKVRRETRYETNRAQERADYEESRVKRREARKKKRAQEERLEEVYRERRHAYKVPGWRRH